WSDAVLLTQWEVARKRCGVGTSTMLTAQSSPWFTFTLHGKVPSRGFRTRPSVDGGIIQITRRADPLVPRTQRPAYERFVRAVFTARGGPLHRRITNATRTDPGRTKQLLVLGNVDARALPKDLTPQHWARLWCQTRQ